MFFTNLRNLISRLENFLIFAEFNFAILRKNRETAKFSFSRKFLTIKYFYKEHGILDKTGVSYFLLFEYN